MNYKSWKRNRVKYLIFLNKDVINEIPSLYEEQETVSNAFHSGDDLVIYKTFKKNLKTLSKFIQRTLISISGECFIIKICYL